LKKEVSQDQLDKEFVRLKKFRNAKDFMAHTKSLDEVLEAIMSYCVEAR
jgi:hypothetical protein